MTEEFNNIQNSVIPYDQNEIEQVMKQLMLANGITDVVYEGSNISQLTSVISYIISTLNINTAINLQETILPLATKRRNILFGARQLGYEPHQKRSYKYKLLIKPKYDETKTIIDPNTGQEVIDTLNTDERTIFLNKNTKFVSGNKTYYYVGETIELCTCSNYDIQYINDPTRGKPKEEITKEIIVIEGDLVTPQDDPALSFKSYNYKDQDGKWVVKQDYIIPYLDVENDYGLQVYLTYIDENGNLIQDEQRFQSDILMMDDTLDYYKDKFIRKENIILGYPTIFFEFAGLGNPIRSGTLINVNVLKSSGNQGEAQSDFEVGDVVGSELFEVLTYELYERGTNEESNESIKENAIVYKNTANRAVTRFDYITILKRNPLVKEADAWGGEDETPKLKGHIWVSCTPSDTYKYIRYKKIDDTYYNMIGDLSLEPNEYVPEIKNFRNWYLIESEQDQILSYLDNYKIMTMELHYRHPLYVDFDFECDVVKYNLQYSKEETNLMIFNTINTFFENTIEKFNSEFINSNLQREIDKTLTYKSGIIYKISTRGVLNRYMFDKYYKEINNQNLIRVFLEYPYENIYQGNTSTYIDPLKIPKIDTQNFGENNGTLSVDYAQIVNPIASDPYIHEADILYTNSTNTYTIGTYRINKLKTKIELDFDFTDDLADEIFGIDDTANGGTNGNYVRFDLVYPFSSEYVTNIPFGNNTIPRLSSVKFIYN